ncbi:MAG: prepilin-type N-terminal cleavage/methylation domain-containing protein, partial [Patescibacteria group bacterium]
MIKIQNSKFPPSRRASKIQDSFTLIEVLVGIFLITIVFFGIFNGFQLATQVIEKSKARIGALAIANQEIENIRNLLYESIGVRAGFPEGILEVSTTTRLNNIDYIIEKKVDFIVDFADG